MVNWEPDLYRRYEAERSQPARDLLARIPLQAPKVVVDLGCGPGNSTQLLAERYPDAEILGLDNSEAMLESARRRLPEVRFETGDITAWRPGATPDLIFANASLQWVPDHATLLPRLLGLLAPGGMLAVQMPDNREEPSHVLMRRTAAEQPWATQVGDVDTLRSRIMPLSGYYDLLAIRAARIEVWRTVYQHPMTSAQAIVDWMRGAGLKVFLERMDEAERPAFLERYAAVVAKAYPPRVDGRLLLAFPRLFFTAVRKG
ncbi:MAG: trans-aconitate 2-methyltransferase [Caulobacteraceae bacterium]